MRSFGLDMVAARAAAALVATAPALAGGGAAAAQDVSATARAVFGQSVSEASSVTGPAEALPTQGLGFIAMAQGQPVDLMTPGQWRRLQALGRDDTQVGLGWRSGRMTAVVGYVKPDAVRAPSFVDGRDRFAAPRPLLGLSVALHYR